MGNFEEIDDEEIDRVITEMLEPLGREDGENPAKVVDDLRVMMQNKVGIIRTRKLLEEALEDLDDLEARGRNTTSPGGRVYNPGWHQALEIAAMIDVSRMCALSALMREESRGGHTRDDFPSPDNSKWGKVNSRIKKVNGKMEIDYTSYPPIPDDLRDLLDSEDLLEEE